jgi:hypothetical protein
MIIDAHTHIGRSENIKATAANLIKSMDEAGIDKSLVFAGALGACPTDYMLEQIAPYKDRLLGVGAYSILVDEKSISWGQVTQLLDWYQEGKIVAIKFYTGYEHYYPVDVAGVLARMERVGCPAIFHMGDCLNSAKKSKLKYAHPLNIDEVAVDYPKMNFIIAHMGFPWIRDSAEVCYKNSNVYSDISGFVYGKFEGNDIRKFSNAVNSFLDIAGNDKLLFGSDWPIANQDSYIETVETLFTQSLCPAPEFLTQNTKRAFKLL